MYVIQRREDHHSPVEARYVYCEPVRNGTDTLSMHPYSFCRPGTSNTLITGLWLARLEVSPPARQRLLLQLSDQGLVPWRLPKLTRMAQPSARKRPQCLLRGSPPVRDRRRGPHHHHQLRHGELPVLHVQPRHRAPPEVLEPDRRPFNAVHTVTAASHHLRVQAAHHAPGLQLLLHHREDRPRPRESRGQGRAPLAGDRWRTPRGTVNRREGSSARARVRRCSA